MPGLCARCASSGGGADFYTRRAQPPRTPQHSGSPGGARAGLFGPGGGQGRAAEAQGSRAQGGHQGQEVQGDVQVLGGAAAAPLGVRAAHPGAHPRPLQSPVLPPGLPDVLGAPSCFGVRVSSGAALGLLPCGARRSLGVPALACLWWHAPSPQLWRCFHLFVHCAQLLCERPRGASLWAALQMFLALPLLPHSRCPAALHVRGAGGF